MAEPPDPFFKIAFTSQVTKQLPEIKEKADQLGILQEVRNTWIQIISDLETKPSEWGDPNFPTKLEGGMVYSGIRRYLGVCYVVYDKQKVVWLLNLSFYPPKGSEG